MDADECRDLSDREQRAVHHQRSGQSRGPQRGQERRRLPVTVRHFRNQTRAFRRAAPCAGHIGFHPRFIEKHQPLGIETELDDAPVVAPLDDVGTVPLGGDQDFFLA